MLSATGQIHKFLLVIYVVTSSDLFSTLQHTLGVAAALTGICIHIRSTQKSCWFGWAYADNAQLHTKLGKDTAAR
jgi:hypothetical protein